MSGPYVVDASVIVNAFRPSEPSHLRSKAFLAATLADGFVEPASFGAEIVSALLRAGVPVTDASTTLAQVVGARTTLVTIGPRAAAAAARVAQLTRLRAGNALYVWVAERHGLPLVTLDREILDRAHLAGVTAREP